MYYYNARYYDPYNKMTAGQNMSGRYYDPALGRWIQPDTIVPDPRSPQSLNRYSYVRNNSLRYTDPLGHQEEDLSNYEKWGYDWRINDILRIFYEQGLALGEDSVFWRTLSLIGQYRPGINIGEVKDPRAGAETFTNAFGMWITLNENAPDATNESYAADLAHEMRHIELGGMRDSLEEEYYCYRASAEVDLWLSPLGYTEARRTANEANYYALTTDLGTWVKKEAPQYYRDKGLPSYSRDSFFYIAGATTVSKAWYAWR